MSRRRRVDVVGTGVSVEATPCRRHDEAHCFDHTRKETLGEKLKEEAGIADTTANYGHPEAATTGSGYEVDDEADDEYPHQDTASAYDSTDPAPRKKGLITKIKEKLRH